MAKYGSVYFESGAHRIAITVYGNIFVDGKELARRADGVYDVAPGVTVRLIPSLGVNVSGNIVVTGDSGTIVVSGSPITNVQTSGGSSSVVSCGGASSSSGVNVSGGTTVQINGGGITVNVSGGGVGVSPTPAPKPTQPNRMSADAYYKQRYSQAYAHSRPISTQEWMEISRKRREQQARLDGQQQPTPSPVPPIVPTPKFVPPIVSIPTPVPPVVSIPKPVPPIVSVPTPVPPVVSIPTPVPQPIDPLQAARDTDRMPGPKPVTPAPVQQTPSAPTPTVSELSPRRRALAQYEALRHTEDAVVTVPGVIDGNAFPAVEGFAHNLSIRKLIIEEGVTTLKARAFQGCTALEEVVLPSSLVVIDEECFEGCVSLACVTFGKRSAFVGVALGRRAFCGTAMTELDLTACSEVREECFADCDMLMRVTLPPLITVGSRAFRGCGAMSEITVSGARGLHDQASFMADAWQDCATLVRFTFDGSNVVGAFPDAREVRVLGGTLYGEPLSRCPSLLDLTFGELSAVTVAGPAFAKAARLPHTVYLPPNVTVAVERAFEGAPIHGEIIVAGGKRQLKSWNKKWKKGCKARILIAD